MQAIDHCRTGVQRILFFCLLCCALLLSTAQPTVVYGQTTVAPDQSSSLYQSKGDQKRSYPFPGTGETIPYRIYVPSAWAPGKKLPLVVILHGGGLDENTPFDGGPDNLKGILVAQAELHGFVVAAPNGYSKDARWGAPFDYGMGPTSVAPPPIDSAEMARINPRAEQDVLNVVELMSQEYGIDRSRMFIMGNSRGSLGTLYLAEAHPELWLAMAPSDGPIAEVETYPYDRLKIKGAVFVHGDKDIGAPIELNRRIAQHVIERSVTTEFIEVPGGLHGSAWYMALPQTFNFLDTFPRIFPEPLPKSAAS
jgi:predicted peptidase